MSDMSDSLPISILCVDDNRIVADAVAARMRREVGLRWIGHLACADDLAAVVSRERPFVILLDVDMPGRDPFDVMSILLEKWPQCRVIIFSGHVQRELLDRAIQSGAWGYVSKSDGADAMLDGILRVAADEFALSPEVRAICGEI